MPDRRFRVQGFVTEPPWTLRFHAPEAYWFKVRFASQPDAGLQGWGASAERAFAERCWATPQSWLACLRRIAPGTLIPFASATPRTPRRPTPWHP